MHEAWHFGNPMSGLALLRQSDLVWYGGQYNHNQIHIVLQHAAPHIGFCMSRLLSLSDRCIQLMSCLSYIPL